MMVECFCVKRSCMSSSCYAYTKWHGEDNPKWLLCPCQFPVSYEGRRVSFFSWRYRFEGLRIEHQAASTTFLWTFAGPGRATWRALSDHPSGADLSLTLDDRG